MDNQENITDNLEKYSPELAKNPDIMSFAKTVDDAKKMRVMAESDSGRALSKALKEKGDSLLLDLRGNYKKSSHIELIAKISAIDIQLGLYDELINAGVVERQAEEIFKEETRSALRQ